MLFVQPPQMLKEREYNYRSLCVQEAYQYPFEEAYA